MSVAVAVDERPPLTRLRHAAVVAELSRHRPGIWSVLYRPLNYEFDPCPICTTRAGRYPHPDCGPSMMIAMQELRVAFQYATEWDTAVRILQELVDMDRRAAECSIGTRWGDRVIYGEAVFP